MKVTNSQKNVLANVPAGDHPGNVLQGLLAHAMNRTQTRSLDPELTAEAASGLGIGPLKTNPPKPKGK